MLMYTVAVMMWSCNNPAFAMSGPHLIYGLYRSPCKRLPVPLRNPGRFKGGNSQDAKF